MYSFPNFEPVCCSTSSSNCCFFTCIQISQGAGKETISLRISQFIVIYTVKDFGIVNEAEVDVFSGIPSHFLWSNRCGQFDLYLPLILILLYLYAAASAKSLQLCPTLCTPIDGSPPGSPVPGIGCHFLLQCMKVKSESEVTQSCPTLVTPWTAAYQAPLSMGFSRQEYWSGVPLPYLT